MTYLRSQMNWYSGSDRKERFNKGIGKDEIKIEALSGAREQDGAIGSSTSDSERAMITEDVTEVLTLIYSFSGNDGLEKALEYGRKYLEEYAGAQNLESWIVE